MTTEHDPYLHARSKRIDYDRIANTGDVAMYARAWSENPDERDVLENIFPDLHAEMEETA